jgi:hypothetical protein
MTHPEVGPTRKRLTSPRAAAVAGILFGLLYGTALILIKWSLREGIFDSRASLEEYSHYVKTALNLIPYSGLAFLWFIGVVRDRIGDFEDRFFATIFLGSGLLYLAMIFVAATLAGGLIANLIAYPELQGDPVTLYARLVMKQITTIYALRMAGIFMTSSAGIFLKTGTLPRWVGILTIVLALTLMFGTDLSSWLELVFPAWVLFVSVIILITNYQRTSHGDAEAI